MTSPPIQSREVLKQGQSVNASPKAWGTHAGSVTAKEELLYHTSAFCRSYSTWLDNHKKKGEVKNEMGATSITSYHSSCFFSFKSWRQGTIKLPIPHTDCNNNSLPIMKWDFLISRSTFLEFTMANSNYSKPW